MNNNSKQSNYGFREKIFVPIYKDQRAKWLADWYKDQGDSGSVYGYSYFMKKSKKVLGAMIVDIRLRSGRVN